MVSETCCGLTRPIKYALYKRLSLVNNTLGLGDAHQFDLLYEGVPPLKHHEEELVGDVGWPVVVLYHPRLDRRKKSTTALLTRP